MQNVTFAELDAHDLDRFGEDNYLKLFRLCQMSIEYLIYSQNYLECLTRSLDMQYKNLYEQTRGKREQIQKFNTIL